MRLIEAVAASGAVLVLAGAAQAQPRIILEADLVPSDAACSARGEPLGRGVAPVCVSTARLDLSANGRLFQLRLEAEVLRAIPSGAPLRRPESEPLRCREDRLAPGVYLCAGTGAQLGECLVDTTEAAGRGEHGPLLEAACVLTEPIRFVVRDPDDVVRFREEVSVVGCLADPAVIGPADPRLDIVADRPVNVCSAAVRLVRQGAAARMSPLARMAPGWKLGVWQGSASYGAIYRAPAP